MNCGFFEPRTRSIYTIIYFIKTLEHKKSTKHLLL